MDLIGLLCLSVRPLSIYHQWLIDTIPLRLALNLKIKCPVKADQHLSWDEVAANTSLATYQLLHVMMQTL